MSMRTEWVIHIWGKEREKLILTPQEKFHIDMIKNQDHSIFDKVLVNISMDNFYDKKLFKLLKNELLNVFSDVKEVEILKCKNDEVFCEYVTFRPYVWDRIGEDVRIFYSHFKGYCSNIRVIGSDTVMYRNFYINEYYWSYLMYRMSLYKEYVDEMKKSFDEGKDIYCWCLLDETNLENISIPEEGIYYTAFFNGVEKINQNVNKYYKKESMAIHSPGSFVWYDMKNIGNHIGLDVVKEISLDHNMIKDNYVSRHYCELFIWRFLDRKNIQEQTFINNIRNQIRTIKNSTYSQLYCSKKVCCEYINDFDKYIIQNKLI